MPVAGDQKIAAGDYLEYRYTYTFEGNTTFVDVRYTFTSVSMDTATVNMTYDDEAYIYPVGIGYENDVLTFTWPDSPDDSFDIFDFFFLMDEASAEKSFAFQNVGLNIVLMDAYTLTNFSFIPHWEIDAYDTNEIVYMVKMGTNIPIYMEMLAEDSEYLMTIELTGSSIGWVTLI